ncbi:hypothetical protein [Burkholderia multivorans]|uniref:hypothetical protein n=1 Tax=Burkholderia multivorans TaxID=87883 RepID=UPI0021BE0728|nr:hypothetical protein [Burkholderia multivorans]
MLENGTRGRVSIWMTASLEVKMYRIDADRSSALLEGMPRVLGTEVSRTFPANRSA